MALVTLQRELSTKPRPKCPVSSPGQLTADSDTGINNSDEVDTQKNYSDRVKKQRSVSECYFVVKGAALILPHDECMHVYRKSPNVNGGTNDIQSHLKSMFYLLREDDTLRMAVKLESMHPGRSRYLVVISAIGPQNNEESCLLGVDCGNRATIGLVLPVLADTMITLDGDGGFSVSSSLRHHIFKPVSVQAMWSALQTLHRCSAKAREYNYFTTGGSHQWVDYYEKCIDSDRSCLNEWHAMDDLVSKRPPSPDSIRTKPTEREATENLIRVKLKEVMMSVDLDEVTSKCIRSSLEEQLDMNLDEYKSFIDQEMLMILGQMDAPTEIFEYLYLGSEWNASNLEELKTKGIHHILNVTREIDNFFPGMFDYLNVRVYDDESTEMLKYWDKTFKYIRKVKSEGAKVLVHCKMGISRSASVVIAYVMKAYDWNFEQALDFVRNKRSCIKPNQGFVKQLEIYQGILDASKQRHNSLWRSKSETNLKVIGIPRHLKKKEFIGSRFISNSEEGNTSEHSPILPDHLTIPGSISRPKSWSPDNSIVETLYSSSPLMLDKHYNLGRQQSSMDPSYYLNLEAGRSITSLQSLKDDKEPIQVLADLISQPPPTLPRVSSIKNRISELESQGGIQEAISQPGSLKSDLTTIKSGNMVVNSKSGLVLNLATQFETVTKPSMPSPDIADVSESVPLQKPVIFTIGAPGDAVEPVLSQTKPPVAKHQAILVKPNTYPRETDSQLSDAQLLKDNVWLYDSSTFSTDANLLDGVAPMEVHNSNEGGNSSDLNETMIKMPSLSSNKTVALDNASASCKIPSQFNLREGFSRQSSSSSCISTPKSVELPFSWSRQSSSSSPSAVSSPPIALRWPKVAAPQSQPILHNTQQRQMEKQGTLSSDKSSSPENEAHPDVKAIQQRLMHLDKTHSTVNDVFASGKDIVYDREEIPWTPGTVRRTKQKLESNTLKRTASFDSSFPSQSRSTPSTPPETMHSDKLDVGLSHITRSKSLRNEHRPRSMAGVFPSNWHATPPATNCAPIPQSSCRLPTDHHPTSKTKMHHSRSTPSVVEAVNQVLCGTREILNSAIQSLPSQSSRTDLSNSHISKNGKKLDHSKPILDLCGSGPSGNHIVRALKPDGEAASGFVEALNPHILRNSLPYKENDPVSLISKVESEGSLSFGNVSNRISPNLCVEPILNTGARNVISHSSKDVSQFNENLNADKASTGVNIDGGNAEQIKIIRELGRNLVDQDSSTFNDSEGVVKRLTKELEAKSGSPAGGRKEKIIIIDKDCKDLSETVKNVAYPVTKSASPPFHGAKNSPLTSADTNFLRKARTRSDVSDRNSLVLESSSNSLLKSSRRKSSLDMDLVNKFSNKTECHWQNGKVLRAVESQNEPVKSKPPPSVVVDRPASFIHTTSTGRPPPGASKPSSSHTSMLPPSPATTDACQQKKCCKQQQGKTHPLSKLTPKQRHPNPLYNTM